MAFHIPASGQLCDFTTSSPCAITANLTTHLSNPQSFLTNMQNGYNQFGCNFFSGRVTHWQGQLPGISNPTILNNKQAKIDWALCTLQSACCGTGVVYFGCMDDGCQGANYINNQAGVGSVLPPDPTLGCGPGINSAINYNSSATQDDGTCYYTVPVQGCCKPGATNYLDPQAYPQYTTFQDCAGNVKNSTAYLSVGPFGDTSCCLEDVYNYRDTAIHYGVGHFRGIPVDGGCGSGGIRYDRQHHDPTTGTFSQGVLGQSSVIFTDSAGNPWPMTGSYQASFTDGVIGLPYFIITPNLKDVNGHLYTESQLTTNKDWIFTIWDEDKNYLGKWKYDKCVFSYTAPRSAGMNQSTGQYQLYNGNWIQGQGAGLEDCVSLVLHGVTHLDGPDPIVNYGNMPIHPGCPQGGVGSQGTIPSVTALYNNFVATNGIVNKYRQPKYYTNNYMFKTNSFAYIKIECDSTLVANSWNDLYGPNTTPDFMNVVCIPPSTIGGYGLNNPNHIPGNVIPSAYGTIGVGTCPGHNPPNPYYGYWFWQHFLHPWPATHSNVAPNMTVYPDLATGFTSCNSFSGGGAKVANPNPEIVITDFIENEEI